MYIYIGLRELFLKVSQLNCNSNETRDIYRKATSRDTIARMPAI